MNTQSSGSLRSKPPAAFGPVTYGNATVHRMVELYASGMGLQEIGLLVNRNPSTVFRVLRRQGVQFRHSGGATVDGLSPMQFTILGLIESYVKEHGFPPSVRELRGLSGLNSTATIAHHIDRLIESGRLRRTPGVARGLAVVYDRKEPARITTLPLESGRYYAQWIEVDSAAELDRHACNCGHRSDWAPIGSGQLTLALSAHPATEEH